MAKQEGIMPIQGTIGKLTFFKSQDGYMVKSKSSISAERIATDEAFARTRESNAEFGRACKAGKQLRLAFRNSIVKTKDNRMVSWLTTTMMLAVHADNTNDRGQRNVIDGEAGLVEGFDFNINAKLSSTLFAPYTVTFDRVTGKATLMIADFIPFDMVVVPEGTTHFQLFAAASIDFENEVFNADSLLSGILPYDSKNTGAITLSPALPADSKHPVFIILGIEFMQQVNGKYYSLKNGAFNACTVVKTDSPV